MTYGPSMINEYIRYRIPGERADAFLAAYATAGASLQASEHCLGYELSHCTEDREQYILKIQWDSAEGHLRGFRASPAFGAFFAAIKPFVGDIAEMRHYELTSVHWSRS